MKKTKPFAHTREQAKRLHKILQTVEDALRDSHRSETDARQLESAIGALFLGQLFGYQVLDIIHSDATRRKYCELLDIIWFRELCPETGPESDRHFVYQETKHVKNFWRAIAGKNDEIPPEILKQKHIIY